MKKTKYLSFGWDPGANGGLACAHINEDKQITFIDVIRFSKSTDQDILLFMAKNLEHVDSAFQAFGVLERVNAMPGQGVSSTFKFGVAYGKAIMAFTSQAIPFILVPPASWQRELGMTKKGASKTEHKRLLKQKAEQMFPASMLADKIVNENADAILLAAIAHQRMRF